MNTVILAIFAVPICVSLVVLGPVRLIPWLRLRVSLRPSSKALKAARRERAAAGVPEDRLPWDGPGYRSAPPMPTGALGITVMLLLFVPMFVVIGINLNRLGH